MGQQSSAPGAAAAGWRRRGAGAKGRVRWAVDAGAWDPEGGVEGDEFQFLLRLIEEDEERETIFKRHEYQDKKTGLIARLLLRQAAAVTLGHSSFKGLRIARTKGRKPYLASPLPDGATCPNWNANCSHEGRWVLCASEPLCLVGVDVAEPRRFTKGGKELDFRETFEAHLSAAEWAAVDAAGSDPDAQCEVFARHWSAKEALVKALGVGLKFPLRRAEFNWTPLRGFVAGSAYEGALTLWGEPNPMWRFVQYRMPGEKHPWVTVGRGPLSEIVDAWGGFSATMRRPQESFGTEEWRAALLDDNPPFELLPVSALVPPDAAVGYMEARSPLEQPSRPGCLVRAGRRRSL